MIDLGEQLVISFDNDYSMYEYAVFRYIRSKHKSAIGLYNHPMTIIWIRNILRRGVFN